MAVEKHPIGPTGLVLDPNLDCRNAVIRAALEYWRSILSSRAMPAPEDLDPLLIPRNVLPHVTLLDIEYEPRKRFRWRLIGTAITELLNRDLTGRYWDETFTDDEINIFAAAVDYVLKTGAPLRFTAKGHVAGKEIYDAEHIYLPLSRDGERIDRLFGVSVFEPRYPLTKTPA